MLGDLEELHANFLEKNPDFLISLSAFRALRPPQCEMVGAKGTHNVCVCKIHGNIRLKQIALKEEFFSKKFNFQDKYKDYLEGMICSAPTFNCYLGDCKKCPGSKKALQKLEATLQHYKIESISFNQWLTTDRYYIFLELFLKNFQKFLNILYMIFF